MLFSGDVVSVAAPSFVRTEHPVPNPGLSVAIVAEDDALLVVDKPAGMACHGFSGEETGTLVNFLLAHYPSLNGVGKSRWEPGLVHRLDRDTSGLVVAAKDQASFENLRGQFRRQIVRKTYAGLVRGWTPDRHVIVYSLTHDPRDKRKMRIVRSGAKSKNQAKQWRAVTRFQTLARSKDFSFLEIEIYTGVTHQIRAHLEAAGFPLVGDPLYGGDAAPGPSMPGRQLLHARSLEFLHPRIGQEVRFESPLPEDLRGVLDGIGILH